MTKSLQSRAGFHIAARSFDSRNTPVDTGLAGATFPFELRPHSATLNSPLNNSPSAPHGCTCRALRCPDGTQSS